MKKIEESCYACDEDSELKICSICGEFACYMHSMDTSGYTIGTLISVAYVCDKCASEPFREIWNKLTVLDKIAGLDD